MKKLKLQASEIISIIIVLASALSAMLAGVFIDWAYSVWWFAGFVTFLIMVIILIAGTGDEATGLECKDKKK